MTYSLRIADLPVSERPRERLMAVGAKNLTEAELLAILISTGQTKGNLSAIGLAQHILQELGKHQRSPLDMLREVNYITLYFNNKQQQQWSYFFLLSKVTIA